MSVVCTSRVWRHSESTGSHRIVLLAIADFANEDGVGWPGQDRLARMSKLSVSSVKRIVSDLVESGELWRGRRREGGPNAYIVLVGLEDEELERATQLVIDLGCDPEDVMTVYDPGITPSTTLVSPTVPPGTTAMDPDPSLPVKEEPSDRGLEKSKPQPPIEKHSDHERTYYYKDKSLVRAIGTVSNGPWEITCPDCGKKRRIGIGPHLQTSGEVYIERALERVSKRKGQGARSTLRERGQGICRTVFQSGLWSDRIAQFHRRRARNLRGW